MKSARIYGVPLLLVFMLGCGLWALMPGRAGAQDVAVPSGPDEEKRSIVQEADGYGYLGDDVTLGQVRAHALADAKRNVVEAVQTRIRSRTEVKDFQVRYDLIVSDAEASIRIIEQKDHGIEDNTRYHVWIKAEVFYEVKTASGTSDSHPLMQPDDPLTVRVWTDRKVYHKGEKILVHILGNKNYYAKVVDVTSTGEIIQLLPNKYRASDYFRAGRVYLIPGAEDRFDLEVTEPFGKDKIVVFAAEAPLGEIPLSSMGDSGLQVYEGGESGLALGVRGIRPVRREESSQSGVGGPLESGAEFYEAAWEVTTRQ